MPPESPPPPGVTQLTDSGARIAPPSGDPDAMERAARKKARGRSRIAPGEDVIKNLDTVGRRTKIKPHTPQGVSGSEVDIVEVPLPTTRKAVRNRATYTSIDGQDYSFKLRLPNGKPDPDAYLKCLYASMREMMLGGNPLIVWDAFKLKLHDADEKLVYPFTDQVLAAINPPDLPPVEYVDDEDDASDFTLGEGD